MSNYDVFLIPMIVSTLLIVLMAVMIGRMKNKKQIHYAFFSIVVFMFIWSFARMLQIIFQDNYRYVIFLEHVSYIGVILIPISLLYTGIIFAKTRIQFSWKQLLLFVIPAVSLVMVFTNGYHNLFIEKYSFISTELVYGKYYPVHEIYSYICIFIGLYHLVYFSIKNSGFFSRQSILICLGTLVPLLIIILSTQKLVIMPVFVENISFSFSILCFMLAILGFNFLNVVPVALEKVVDHISDSYIVINEHFEIIDYNRTFVETFRGMIKVKRGDNIMEFFRDNPSLGIDETRFTEYVGRAAAEKTSLSFEKHIQEGDFGKYFTIEVTPILSNQTNLGTIILLKDITQHKLDMEKIKQAHKQLSEKERLASLGELAGGVAHDIKSPLSAVQYNFYELKSLIDEYENGTKDHELEEQDYIDIAKDMRENISRSERSIRKITTIIDSILNHTRNLSGDNQQVFDLEDIVKDLQILLRHHLVQSSCELVYKCDGDIKLFGDSGKLGQVLTNLIMNAIQAYNKKPGVIQLKAERENNNAVVSVTDNAGGIQERLKDGIFKNILTTKGTEGTGLGLYISYSIITGNFGGTMWFETEEGKGTTFFISIPTAVPQQKKEVT